MNDDTHNSTCADCGEPFTPRPGSGRPSKRCHECRRRRDLPKYGRCSVCGAEFLKHGNQKRCPEHFRGNNNMPVRRVVKTCRWCLRDFTVTVGRAGRQLCCSNDCHRNLTYHARTWGAPDRCALPVCVCCGNLTGKPFPNRRADRGLDSKIRRCVDCELPENVATNGRKNARKRRRESVRAGETFTVDDLIERDGDGCHICGDPVRLDVSHQAPEYATIDHLVPIAKGGEHTMANTAVSHRHCNNVRGTRGEPVQLRLVG